MLSFYDHHRQSYHHLKILPNSGNEVAEFMVGNYAPEPEGGVEKGGEFRIVLKDLQNGREPWTPHLQVFGDGLGSAKVLLALADMHGVDLLADVVSRDDFSKRLIGLGLKDLSDNPMGGAPK